jgi:hypothetical protein
MSVTSTPQRDLSVNNLSVNKTLTSGRIVVNQLGAVRVSAEVGDFNLKVLGERN